EQGRASELAQRKAYIGGERIDTHQQAPGARVERTPKSFGETGRDGGGYEKRGEQYASGGRADPGGPAAGGGQPVELAAELRAKSPRVGTKGEAMQTGSCGHYFLSAGSSRRARAAAT